MKVLYWTVSELQSTHTEGFFIVTGDFNQANMKSVLPHFHQHFHHHEQHIQSSSPSPLGSSDHLSVMLIPAYKPLLVRGKPTMRQVRVWSEGAMEAPQDCFESTYWDMFKAAATYDDHIMSMPCLCQPASTNAQTSALANPSPPRPTKNPGWLMKYAKC